MGKFWMKLILALSVAVLSESSVINDAICDRQLQYFDEALNNRERWSLFGRKWEKFKMSFCEKYFFV
jgi:hypothetical protein